MKICAIYAGENVSYAVNDKGTLFGWGEVNFFLTLKKTQKEYLWRYNKNKKKC